MSSPATIAPPAPDAALPAAAGSEMGAILEKLYLDLTEQGYEIAEGFGGRYARLETIPQDIDRLVAALAASGHSLAGLAGAIALVLIASFGASLLSDRLLKRRSSAAPQGGLSHRLLPILAALIAGLGAAGWLGCHADGAGDCHGRGPADRS